MNKKVIITICIVILVLIIGAFAWIKLNNTFDKSNPIIFEKGSNDNYSYVIYQGREYVPYCAYSQYEREKYLGYVGDDKQDEVYIVKGYSEEEWLINYLDSGMMNDCMLLKEKNVTNIPDGLISEYEWNNIIGNLIYESTEIPNEDIVQNEEDKVYQTIKIFQNESNDIIVNATSNYVGFEDLQYTFRSNSKISKEDVKVKWLTLMGSQEASEDNARVIADVIISNDGNVISERKINFMSKAIDIVIDSIKQ